METVNKVKSTVTAAPIGAVGGAVIGYLIAKKIGYDKTLMVVSFAMVGLIIGATIGQTLKK
jgi:outer membrane lipoprotein SlyB